MVETHTEAALRQKEIGCMHEIVTLEKLEIEEDIFTAEQLEAIRALGMLSSYGLRVKEIGSFKMAENEIRLLVHML
ncbi:hypothetical protein FRB94_003394 [Tulasnella sp. JGI-2019a]|nr:hypothetical protein FRB93_004127 [Tulasnella sp. JGI-2019a]KAG9003081.1 hypothetical protein FRB94_003394 [Tulasnella sp. JGI-2019a]